MPDISYQPRRSALYVPAINKRALAKAPTLNADVLIYDFEDAVLADQKEQARNNLSDHLSALTHKAEIIIRINGTKTSAFYDDLLWLESNSNIDGLLLPKTHNANEIEQAKYLLKEIGFTKQLWVLIETVDSILNLGQIVKTLKKNSSLVLGAEDLAKQMRINPTPGRLGLLPILTQLILHGRSAGLNVLDAVFPKLEHNVGFRQSCEQARNLGFDGKTLIHPGQIAIANEMFSPTPLEIKRAEKIIMGWQHRATDKGVILVDGEVIELLHVEQARELLERAGIIPNIARRR